VREPPPDFDDSELLAIVRTQWFEHVDRLEHLPVGFGAHHWAAYVDGEPTLFVTLDQMLPRRAETELEDAYATAAHLAASGLEFVVASIPSSDGPFTVAAAGGAISASSWVDGRSGDGAFCDAAEVTETASLLDRLHTVEPLRRTPRWRPLVDDSFAEEIELLAGTPWRTGPYGERARAALVEHLVAIERWSSRYVLLADAALADSGQWVTTHGEPHTANHLVTSRGRLLVDWESVKVAPRERDLRPLLESKFEWGPAYDGATPIPEMLEMFDLEWRLDEIDQYAHWFATPHTGTASDEVAFAGLVEELTRDEWHA
jgi:spectinomycin phosphotransferase